MSHELRTPLNAILGFGQVLEMEDLGPEDNEGVGYILKAGRHLLQLIDEVLDISRIEAGRMTLSLEPIDVAQIVREVLDLARPLAAARHIQLVDEVARRPTRWHILADQQRLKQVLLNLVSNAIKYNREGGQVTVACAEQPGERLRLLVQDTGAGLRPDEVARLFTPFERLGAERTGIEGTGIGLALSKRLMEAMGGTIGVESVVGEGSTFWIELPLADSAAARRAAGAGCREQRRRLRALPGQRTVLYIEDNLSNLALIEHLLEQGGRGAAAHGDAGQPGAGPGARTSARPDPAGHAPAGHHGRRGAAPPASRSPDTGDPGGRAERRCHAKPHHAHAGGRRRSLSDQTARCQSVSHHPGGGLRTRERTELWNTTLSWRPGF